jgi:hypothetical protein
MTVQPVQKTISQLKEMQPEARHLILEMVAGGATKVAIAKATGVTDMTILTVAQGKTMTFRKLKKLQRVYDRWKAGTLDLSGKRGKKKAETSVSVESPVIKKSRSGETAPVRKLKTVNKPEPTVRAKRVGRPPKTEAVKVSTGFQLPNVTEEMVAKVEEQIRRLQAEAKFMRDLIAIRKKYGM